MTPDEGSCLAAVGPASLYFIEVMPNNFLQSQTIDQIVIGKMSREDLISTIHNLTTRYEYAATQLIEVQTQNHVISKELAESKEAGDEMYELLRWRQFQVQTYANIFHVAGLFWDRAETLKEEVDKHTREGFYASQRQKDDVDMSGLPEDWQKSA